MIEQFSSMISIGMSFESTSEENLLSAAHVIYVLDNR